MAHDADLLEFIHKNDIPTVEGVPYEKSPEEVMKENLEGRVFQCSDVPYFDKETDNIGRYSATLEAKVLFKKDKSHKLKTIIKVVRTFNFDGAQTWDEIDFNTAQEAIEFMQSETDFGNFLKYHNLFFDGRYLRNFEFQRVIYIDGKIVKVGDDK